MSTKMTRLGQPEAGSNAWNQRATRAISWALALVAVASIGCAPEGISAPPGGGGGSGGNGGSRSGGSSAPGGSPGSGGAPGSGGSIGLASGGSGSGGRGSGGSGSGGAASGGSGTGGTGTGGAAGGMTGTGGRGGAAGRMGSGGIGAGGSPGTAGAGGDSLCVPGRYIICEGFESTAPGTNVAPAGWTRSGAVDVVMDAANVYRGTRSMRINAAASGARRISKSGADVAALGGSHWGRVFYKVQTPAPRPASGVVHSTMVGGSAASPLSGGGTIEVRVVDTVEDTMGRHQFLYNVQPESRGEFGKGSSYNWMYDGNWHCAEWRVDYATQNYHYYFDGAEITQIAINNGAGNFANSEIPMVFSNLFVGWNNYQMSSPGFVAWFDEIAMDVNRIGCGN